jgi:hypothetical protein
MIPTTAFTTKGHRPSPRHAFHYLLHPIVDQLLRLWTIKELLSVSCCLNDFVKRSRTVDDRDHEFRIIALDGYGSFLCGNCIRQIGSRLETCHGSVVVGTGIPGAPSQDSRSLPTKTAMRPDYPLRLLNDSGRMHVCSDSERPSSQTFMKDDNIIDDDDEVEEVFEMNLDLD